MLLDAERRILDDLKTRHIDAPADREKTLVRALASNYIILHFERAAINLWASQLACLRFLNSREGGADISELVTFYNLAKDEYPTWYENYPFDGWLGFLRSFNLVGEKDSKAFITVAGREFLKYLVAAGKAGPLHG